MSNIGSRDVELERERCTKLIQALLDSLHRPTALSLVITAERMFAGPTAGAAVMAERRRCIAIVDAAAMRDFTTNPAQWAMTMIRGSADEVDANILDRHRKRVGTPSVAPGYAIEEDITVSQSEAPPPVITEPLTVDPDGDEIALDGDERVNVKLTRDAALETGIDLVNTALGIGGSTGISKAKRR